MFFSALAKRDLSIKDLNAVIEALRQESDDFALKVWHEARDVYDFKGSGLKENIHQAICKTICDSMGFTAYPSGEIRSLPDNIDKLKQRIDTVFSKLGYAIEQYIGDVDQKAYLKDHEAHLDKNFKLFGKNFANRIERIIETNRHATIAS